MPSLDYTKNTNEPAKSLKIQGANVLGFGEGLRS